MSLSLLPGSRIVAATHNPGKAREIAAILGDAFDIVAAGELGLPEPEETETTFVGNALLKARTAARLSGLVALADDSGLSIVALNGDPGVYSARWAGPQKDFARAMEIIEHKLRIARTEAPDTVSTRAYFTCALAVAWPEGHGCVFEGRIDGDILFPPKGAHGFGYDPIFQPDGYGERFAEMTPEKKDAISHRARAFAQLKAALL